MMSFYRRKYFSSCSVTDSMDAQARPTNGQAPPRPLRAGDISLWDDQDILPKRRSTAVRNPHELKSDGKDEMSPRPPPSGTSSSMIWNKAWVNLVLAGQNLQNFGARAFSLLSKLFVLVSPMET